MHGRWLTGLTALGYRDRKRADQARTLAGRPIGPRNCCRCRVGAVGVQPLGVERSRHRGEVEQLIARERLVISAAVRAELAEDLTSRALDRCVPLLQHAGVPEDIRALTSRHVLDVEADLVSRPAAHGTPTPARPAAARQAGPATGRHLDARQVTTVGAFAGDLALVVVEGAAGPARPQHCLPPVTYSPGRSGN